MVYTDNTDCDACFEHCPTKAVDMVLYPNPANKRLKIPEVKPEYCIGWGGGEHACPTQDDGEKSALNGHHSPDLPCERKIPMKTILVLLLALVSLSAPASAQPAPANDYECIGDGVSVYYSEDSFEGGPQVYFTFDNTTIVRFEDEFSISETDLGYMVTTVYRKVPNVFTETLTVILPAVNVTERRPEVTFATRFFKTHTRTPKGGPEQVKGLIQQSTSYRLVCKACAAMSSTGRVAAMSEDLFGSGMGFPAGQGRDGNGSWPAVP